MPFVAGNDIHAHCPKCEKDVEHTVLDVHEGGIVRKVRCKVCSAVHDYHRPHMPAKAKAKPKKAAAKRRTKKPAKPKPNAWEELMVDRDPTTARSYAFKEAFAKDELVAHPKFGLGVVTAVLDAGKIEVVFQEGVKKMVHDRG